MTIDLISRCLRALALLMALCAAGHTLAEDAPVPSSQQLIQQEWSDIITPFIGLGEDLSKQLYDPSDELERNELYEFIFSQVASGYAMLFYADPAHPDWWPLFSHVIDALWANPDTVYYYAPVDADGTYKLTGYRGEVHVVDVQLGGGLFVTQGITTGGMGKVQGNYDLDSLEIADNGYFEIIVSPTRPEGYQGNWLPMTPDTTYLLIRQVNYNWLDEQLKIGIDRLDTPARRERRSPEQLQASLKQLATWVRTWVNVSYGISKRDRARGKKDEFILVDWTESGFGDQKYAVNSFQLADDEAIVIESDIPESCRYWSFQMVTPQWRAINPLHNQSNLNPYYAKLDSDGKFRAVIANADPGVPNWLDAGGLHQAQVYARWNSCSSLPMPTAKTVKLKDVRDYLPEDTPQVSAEERELSLRARRQAAQFRRRW